MFLFKGTKVAFFDVDDTLLKWCPTEDEKEDDGIDHNFRIISTSIDGEGRLIYKEKVEEDAYIPIKVHINQLKEHKRHGHTVVVWSAGGAEWAAKAVSMLGIEDYVDLCMDKPTSVYDDKQVSEFMPKAQYLVKPEEASEDGEESLKKEVPRGYENDTIGETTHPRPRRTMNNATQPTTADRIAPFNPRR